MSEEKCMVCGHSLDEVKNAEEGRKFYARLYSKQVKLFDNFLKEKNLEKEYIKWSDIQK